MRQFAYIYLFVTTISLLIVIGTLKYSELFRKKKNFSFFEMVKVEDASGKSKETVSAIASGIVLVAILSVGLIGMWLLMKIDVLMQALIIGSQSFLIGNVFYRICHLQRRIPILRTHAKVISFVLGIAIGSLWFFWPSWVAYNIVGALSICAILSSVQISQIRFIAIGLGAILVYDAIAVFMTPFMTDVIAHEGVLLPLALVVPLDPFALFVPIRENLAGLLGFGDVIFSGIVIITARKYNLEWWVCGGFALGILCALLAAQVYSHPMPAMMFLSPSLMTTLMLGAWVRQRQLAW